MVQKNELNSWNLKKMNLTHGIYSIGFFFKLTPIDTVAKSIVFLGAYFKKNALTPFEGGRRISDNISPGFRLI